MSADDASKHCKCSGAIGIRVMLWRLTEQNPHDEDCPTRRGG